MKSKILLSLLLIIVLYSCSSLSTKQSFRFINYSSVHVNVEIEGLNKSPSMVPGSAFNTELDTKNIVFTYEPGDKVTYTTEGSSLYIITFIDK